MSENKHDRKLEDFDVIEKMNGRTADGCAASRGELFKKIKKPLRGDSPSRPKYSKTHFIKKICRAQGSDKLLHPELSIYQAIDEVRAQEFLRLMMPTQPKGRLYLNKSGKEVYVSSKEIPGFISFSEITGEVIDKFSCENYGEEGGFKGLGELVYFSLYVLRDSDFRKHNLGYVGRQIYKIDGGGAFQGSLCDEFIATQMECLAANANYIREFYSAHLKFIVLPDNLIQTFKGHYNVGERIGIKSGGGYFINARKAMRKKFDTAQFREYILSEEAVADIKAYRRYLRDFILQGKKLLLDECPDALQDIDTNFLRYRNEFQAVNAEEVQSNEKKSELEPAIGSSPLTFHASTTSQMTSPKDKHARQFEDFAAIELDLGSIGSYGDLYKMIKKPLGNDTLPSSKYSQAHFFKRICIIPKAIDEVRAQEFLRLMMPTQPKGRLYLNKSGKEVYVSSKEILGFVSFESLDEENEILNKFSFKNYGTSRGFKGLGELYYFAGIVLKDELTSHNLGYVGRQIYKLDGGRAFDFGRYDNAIGKQIKYLKKHPKFVREFQSANLKFIVLPDDLIKKFNVHHNVGLEIGIESGDDYFIFARDNARRCLIGGAEKCKAYILSAEAIDDIKAYKTYLKGFKLQGKIPLLDEFPKALHEIDEYFLTYRNEVEPINDVQKQAIRKALAITAHEEKAEFVVPAVDSSPVTFHVSSTSQETVVAAAPTKALSFESKVAQIDIFEELRNIPSDPLRKEFENYINNAKYTEVLLGACKICQLQFLKILFSHRETLNMHFSADTFQQAKDLVNQAKNPDIRDTIREDILEFLDEENEHITVDACVTQAASR